MAWTRSLATATPCSPVICACEMVLGLFVCVRGVSLKTVLRSAGAGPTADLTVALEPPHIVVSNIIPHHDRTRARTIIEQRGANHLDSEKQVTGVPREAWDYRLGNRSALEWVLDQHKEKTPKDPTIRKRFNTYRFADHKEKVIDLLMRVTRVSVETVAIVEAMRQLPASERAAESEMRQPTHESVTLRH